MLPTNELLAFDALAKHVKGTPYEATVQRLGERVGAWPMLYDPDHPMMNEAELIEEQLAMSEDNAAAYKANADRYDERGEYLADAARRTLNMLPDSNEREELAKALRWWRDR